MGASISQSRGNEQLQGEELQRIFDIPDGVWLINSNRFRPDALCSYSSLDDGQRLAAKDATQERDTECDRAIGCLLGLLIGDALGAPLEFHPVRYEERAKLERSEMLEKMKFKPKPRAATGTSNMDLTLMQALQVDVASTEGSHEDAGSSEQESSAQQADSHGAAMGFRAGFDPSLWAEKSDMRETNRFLLEMGQWTDDTAMALCLADSLLKHQGFHPRDLRLRFLAWWTLGYNNAFGRDKSRSGVWGSAESVGLGGIIGDSLKEFSMVPADYTKTGSRHSSGNGSIMRNAPVAIMYRHQLDVAMEVAWRQSKTTHQGDEAADCARLLTWICVRAMRGGKAVLDDLEGFDARLYSTKCLAASMQEKMHEENKGMDLQERNWNWRDANFQYAPTRVAEHPGYAGSYCMDCLAMALHCVHWTKSFDEAVLRAANLCGDADTVAAVTGQIAGAIYGASAIPTRWRHVVERWDAGDTFVRAWLLFSTKPSLNVAEHEQPDGKSWTGIKDAEPEDDELLPLPPEQASPMPFPCPCGRRFANATLRDMHAKKCKG